MYLVFVSDLFLFYFLEPMKFNSLISLDKRVKSPSLVSSIFVYFSFESIRLSPDGNEATPFPHDIGV